MIYMIFCLHMYIQNFSFIQFTIWHAPITFLQRIAKNTTTSDPKFKIHQQILLRFKEGIQWSSPTLSLLILILWFSPQWPLKSPPMTSSLSHRETTKIRMFIPFLTPLINSDPSCLSCLKYSCYREDSPTNPPIGHWNVFLL
jgi:hypothetical protein